MALAADLTREEHRTKAMAAIGMTIGVTFALSLIIAPALNRLIGVPGIFVMTGVLALLAMVVVSRIVPDPVVSRFHSDTEAVPGRFNNVLHDPELLRLDFGVFALHAVLMALWLVVPLSLRNAGLCGGLSLAGLFPGLGSLHGDDYPGNHLWREEGQAQTGIRHFCGPAAGKSGFAGVRIQFIVGHGSGAAGVLRCLQPAGGDFAFAHFEDRAGRSERHCYRRL